MVMVAVIVAVAVAVAVVSVAAAGGAASGAAWAVALGGKRAAIATAGTEALVVWWWMRTTITVSGAPRLRLALPVAAAGPLMLRDTAARASGGALSSRLTGWPREEAVVPAGAGTGPAFLVSALQALVLEPSVVVVVVVVYGP